ncbi:MAG: ATP-binding protein, partial [Myxococcales bacterium]|nr:ATP-binding protein [Myxococcales bacterium]
MVGTTGDFAELAQDCVCFANGAGGTLLIGIEDNADAPPSIQRVDPARLDRIRKRVGELTVNVQVMPELKRHENGGEYIALTIPRTVGVASTSDGRWVPTICEGTDSVHVTVPRRVVQPGVIKLLVEADKRYQLTQRERITFALIAQSESVSAAELTEELELPDSAALRPWLGRLLAWGLVEQSGRTKATRYFVPPALLREAGLDALTTLTRVQP